MSDVARGSSGGPGKPGTLLVIISGPSGVGKDTIIEELRGRPRMRAAYFVVTCTTRGRRPGEVDGVDYHFLSPERFRGLEEATATGRRGPRWPGRWPTARTSSSRSTSRARRTSRRGCPRRSSSSSCHPPKRRSSSGSGRGPRNPPRSSRSASATPRSSSPSRTCTTTSW
ncbi:MAG: hypothetical protein E6I94_02275 [Chloroflexi bacterium]|nr:MAG: hypothetical protein E6I94_02275 [Chloroflexota bacterium]